MKTIFCRGAFIFALLILHACDSGYERKVTEQEVPPAVLQAFKTAYPNAEVRGYSEEKEGGKTIYEIALVNAGQRLDLAYAADGSLLEVEETIDPANLPPAAHDEIKNAFKDAVIARAERVVKGASTGYEAKVDVPENGATTRYELVFDQDGKLLKKEVEEEDDEE
jgi:hypothetical protein